MDQKQLLTLWGKTDRDDPQNFHPLLFHLFDVAHCAAELWTLLPKTMQKRLAAAIHLDVVAAGTFYALLAGLHDLGKAYPNFQNKVDRFIPILENIGFDFPARTDPSPHNFVSIPEVQRLLKEGLLLSHPLQRDIFYPLAYALGAHHGVFATVPDLDKITARTLGKNPLWQEARNALAELLADALTGSYDSAPPKSLTEFSDPVFVPMLAAFISLADWFGSSRHFPMQGAQDITDYITASRRRAGEALNQSGWTKPVEIEESLTFTQLFSYLNPDGIVEPNTLQVRVVELLVSVNAPSLWIVEQEMGAGKTEAAFTIFDACRVKGLAHGTYIAMPTQATSNAMFTRLGDFLIKGRTEQQVNLILAHSHAFLDPNYRTLIQRADQFNSPIYNGPERTEAEEGALLVRSWFTARKQTLLAHFGVGTIDQCLLGVLHTRHWFVRLYGLAGKVVIFDEVHAYDLYMSSLLERVIGWLAELDCTVVLLSATLPKNVRLTLADAYHKGARAELEAQTDPPVYPRITLIQKGQAEAACAYAIPPKPISESKSISLLHLPVTPNAVQTAILEAIPGDGCAIVICNTVAQAQAMYTALRDNLKPLGWHCLLFHARMPFGWRKEREEKVLGLFDKSSGENRTKPRSKTLLVATQVVEQSLDLDADFMASELAPADLILQRMGRLYRHNRARNTVQPTFVLLCNVEEAGAIPNLGVSAYVYSAYTLLRSWYVLRDKQTISLPDDIEPIVTAVYDDPDPIGLSDIWLKTLTEQKQVLDNEQKHKKIYAGRVSVSLPGSTEPLTEWLSRQKLELKDEDDPQVHSDLKALTRDGDPSITVICCGTDAEGNPLAPDPKGRITWEQIIEMMRFSLPISQKSLYYTLASETPPVNWKADAHLKYSRRIVFDKGSAMVGRKHLKLSKEMGLEIEGGVQTEAEE